ncbi:MAG: hypothetical protein EP299_01790 [Acidobacteria bacterium]|nr:MAG: hypothetical protein EP299_01790 [Acidobacteriota bacterium]
MGQYYYTVNLDKWEFVHPHRLGDGLKAREFSYGPTSTILCALLTTSTGAGGGDWPTKTSPRGELVVGRWANDRIAIVGDYAEPEDVRFDGLPIGDLIFSLCDTDEEVLKHWRYLAGQAEQMKENDHKERRWEEHGYNQARMEGTANRLRMAYDRWGAMKNVSQPCLEWYEMQT